MRISLRGAAFEYEDAGSGPAVLLIHAFPLDHHLWRDQINHLARRFRVLAPDLRGFGESDDPAGSLSLEDYGDDLIALLDALSIDRAVWCGLSMGGYIAFAMMARHAGRARGLVLSNTRSSADTEAARQARLDNARRAESGEVSFVAESMLPRMLSPASLKDNPALSRTVLDMMRRQRGAGLAAALRAMAARPDRAPLLPSIEVPALIIAGDQDPLIPVGESRAMAAAIPGAELVVIPGAGHLSNLECRDMFNETVERFLTRIH